ncbi:MAG: ANTAR domain-containing protein [Acidimicrobiales bacterium]
MDQAGLSEHDAFSFIQRTAMRERLTMKVVSEQVLAGELRPDPAADQS